MPRGARIDKSYLLQHVIVKAVEGRRLFLDHADYAAFRDRLELLLQQTRTTCFAWSLMPDHFHLLLMTEAESLGHFMRRLLVWLVKTSNSRHGRAGRLLHGRYKSTVCDDLLLLPEMVRYIHLNPLRGGVVTSFKELERYPWTGHAVIAGLQTLKGQGVEKVLRRFGRKRENCLMRYRRFVRKGRDHGYRDELAGGGLRRMVRSEIEERPQCHDPRILGDSQFVREVKEGLVRLAPGTWKPKFYLPARPAPPVAEVVRQVAEVLETTTEEIVRPGRSKVATRARSAICYIAHRRMGHSGATVARELGISPSAVCRRVAAGNLLVQRNQRLDEILHGPSPEPSRKKGLLSLLLGPEASAR